MLPYEHALYGLIVAVVLFLFHLIPLTGALILWLVSFLIDVDHYAFYVLAKHDFNLRRAYHFFAHQDKSYYKQKSEYRAPLCAFHTVEVLLLVIVLSFYYKIALYILIGMLLHFIGDFYHTIILMKAPRLRRYTIFNFIKEKLF